MIRRRAALNGAGKIAGLALAASPLALAGCDYAGVEVWQVSFGFAPPTPPMLPWPSEPRLGYEPGAEALAEAVAATLPGAVAQVETWHQLSFLAPPVVLAFADAGRFAHFSALPPGPQPAAITRERAVHLAPALATAGKRVVGGFVTHELAHLLLHQRIGLRGTGRLPPWFLEGVAVEASGGGGAEGANEAEARQALRAGHRFTPEEANGFLAMPRNAAAHGLSNALFYRQAGLFIRWLRARDERRFIALLHRAATGEALSSAFPAALGLPVAAAWQGFLASQG